MLLALFGVAVGALIGTRFTVLALIPAMTVILIIVGVGRVTGGGSFGPTIIELALVLTCLQIGYLGSAAFGFRFPLQRNLRENIGRSLPPATNPRAGRRWWAKAAGK